MEDDSDELSDALGIEVGEVGVSSWRLVALLKGQTIKDAALVDSKSVFCTGPAGEHLELSLSNGFVISLPYKNTLMDLTNVSKKCLRCNGIRLIPWESILRSCPDCAGRD